MMHAKPDLRVFLKWMIAGSGSVITDVIQRDRIYVSTGLPFMTPASKAGHIRSLTYFLSLAGMFLASWIHQLAWGRWPDHGFLLCSLLFAAIVICMAALLISIFWWRTRCPQCQKGIAKFTHDKDVEFLTCSSCGFSEKTGYTMGD